MINQPGSQATSHRRKKKGTNHSSDQVNIILTPRCCHILVSLIPCVGSPFESLSWTCLGPVYFPFFFDSIVGSNVGILHVIEIPFDLVYPVSVSTGGRSSR